MGSPLRQYGYGAVQRWVLGLSGFVFAWLPLYAWLRGDNPTATPLPVSVLTLMGWASLFYWWRFLPIIEVDERGITRRRLGRSLTIGWDELSAIAMHGWGCTIVLRSPQGSIRIEEQVEEYTELVELLRARRPDLVRPRSISFPVVLHRRLGWNAWGVGLLLAGVLLVHYYGRVFWDDSSWSFSTLYKTFFGLVCAGAGLWMLLMTELRVVLKPNLIERHTPLGRERHPVHRLVDVERIIEEHPDQGVNQQLCLIWLSSPSSTEASAHVLLIDGMRLNGDLEVIERFVVDNYVWIDDEDRYADAA